MNDDARSIPRIGARRLVRGEGRYVDDLAEAGAAHAAFVRSPVAHAVIRGVDAEPARRMPGVIAVYAAADLDALGVRPLPVGWTVLGQRPSVIPVLTRDRVRYVGEPVALVVAETRYVAEDAVELVGLDLDPLVPVLDPVQALGGDAPVLHPEWGDNVLARQVIDSGEVDAAFDRAPVVVAGEFTIARQTGVPMECRGALARYDDTADDELVVVSSSQSPHHAAEHLTEALGRARRPVRVIAPDVGGSFGIKDHACVEEAAVAAAAIALRRPVRWLQDRWENLVAGVHSRGQVYELELAADEDARLVALRGRLVYDAGARSGNHGAGTAVYSSLVLPGPYRLERYRLEMLAVVTNAPPAAAYRGYGAPEAAFAMEGMLDRLAIRLELDPAEVRRRNLITADEYPYRTASGLEYDSGDPRKALDRALELAAEAPAPAPGRRRGTGIGMFVLMGGFGPTRAALDAGMTFGGYETARVRMDRAGHVTVSIGMPTQGQGVETALAQTAAAELGVDPATDVHLDSSDTARVPYSPVGAIASRGAAVGGAAVAAASQRLAAQLRRMAGELLGAPADSVILRGGAATVADGRSTTLSAVATAIQQGHLSLREVETALEASATVDPTAETFSYGAHVAVADVDPATGTVQLVRYGAVSDCGRLINPAIVRGQVEGGIVQGIGGALMEAVRLDADGAPLAGTLFDYVVPTAPDVPPLLVELFETPSPVTPTGARGAGEIGIIGPGAAIAGAVTAALGGAEPVSHLPLTPPEVRRLAAGDSTGREGPAHAPVPAYGGSVHGHIHQESP
ncbi:MAG TPA: xanthine dehydrogenase family protein molybdopterin-binding subunit [Solirubrobacteraceae bacterium]